LAKHGPIVADLHLLHGHVEDAAKNVQEAEHQDLQETLRAKRWFLTDLLIFQ
jgi:hypothetical protein